MNEELKNNLEAFLLEKDLDELNNSYESNIFDILNITRAELKHSIMLAYLLDPNENHGLGSKVLEHFIEWIAKNIEINKIEVFDLIDIDYDDFIVQREFNDIDILIKSNSNKIIICIENKIDTGEHDNQLEKYKNYIESQYSDKYKKIYLFLTPNGIESSNPELWKSISYKDIWEILNKLEIEKLESRVKLLIEDYKNILRRKIMGENEELKDLCNKIYKKHKKAIDLINEYKEKGRDINYSVIMEIIQGKQEKGKIIYDGQNSTMKYIRFTTNMLNKAFPLLEDNKSAWGNKHSVYYEIVNLDNSIVLQIAWGYKGIDNRKQRYDDIVEFLSSNNISFNKKYSNKNAYLVYNLGSIDTENLENQYNGNIKNEIKNELEQLFEGII